MLAQGTGSELIYLAQRFPQWHFTAVEPSAPMLDVCRRRVEACGIASRCVFHEGYLDSLPGSGAFDAATSLLVSHFILERGARSNFFRAIAKHSGRTVIWLAPIWLPTSIPQRTSASSKCGFA